MEGPRTGGLPFGLFASILRSPIFPRICCSSSRLVLRCCPGKVGNGLSPNPPGRAGDKSGCLGRFTRTYIVRRLCRDLEKKIKRTTGTHLKDPSWGGGKAVALGQKHRAGDLAELLVQARLDLRSLAALSPGHLARAAGRMDREGPTGHAGRTRRRKMHHSLDRSHTDHSRSHPGIGRIAGRIAEVVGRRRIGAVVQRAKAHAESLPGMPFCDDVRSKSRQGAGGVALAA